MRGPGLRDPQMRDPQMRDPQMRDPGGFALLIVLWSLVLVALIVTSTVTLGMQEIRLAGNLRDAASLSASADGGIYTAIFHLLDRSADHWAADGSVHRLDAGSGRLLVRVTSEAGKVNINTAHQDVLAALLHVSGMAPEAAPMVAANIIAWRSLPGQDEGRDEALAAQYRAAGLPYRPPQAPFESTRELGLVLGMSPPVLSRVLPYVTIHHDGDTDPLDAPPVIREALREVYGTLPVSGRTEPDARFVTIAVTAERAHGRANARASRTALVMLGPLSHGELFKILVWTP